MARFNVIPSDDFNRDVKDHLRFVADVSIPASRKLSGLFKKAIAGLADTAASFPLFYKQYRKINVADRYAIFYEIIGNDVYVEYSHDMRTGVYNDIILENEQTDK